VGFPIAAAGTVGYVIAGWSLRNTPPGTLGYIYLPALITISIASMATAPLGAHLAHRLDMRILKRIFAVLLFALAGYMIYNAVTFVEPSAQVTCPDPAIQLEPSSNRILASAT
jgi:uncharacterized membrane protein YfcA